MTDLTNLREPESSMLERFSPRMIISNEDPLWDKLLCCEPEMIAAEHVKYKLILIQRKDSSMVYYNEDLTRFEITKELVENDMRSPVDVLQNHIEELQDTLRDIRYLCDPWVGRGNTTISPGHCECIVVPNGDIDFCPWCIFRRIDDKARSALKKTQ